MADLDQILLHTLACAGSAASGIQIRTRYHAETLLILSLVRARGSRSADLSAAPRGGAGFVPQYFNDAHRSAEPLPKRRCAVQNATPNDGCKSRRAQPLVSTHTIAVNTARASSAAVPPPAAAARTVGSTAPSVPTAHPAAIATTPIDHATIRDGLDEHC